MFRVLTEDFLEGQAREPNSKAHQEADILFRFWNEFLEWDTYLLGTTVSPLRYRIKELDEQRTFLNTFPHGGQQLLKGDYQFKFWWPGFDFNIFSFSSQAGTNNNHRSLADFFFNQD